MLKLCCPGVIGPARVEVAAEDHSNVRKHTLHQGEGLLCPASFCSHGLGSAKVDKLRVMTLR
jgi:hypothetical protein